MAFRFHLPYHYHAGLLHLTTPAKHFLAACGSLCHARTALLIPTALPGSPHPAPALLRTTAAPCAPLLAPPPPCAPTHRTCRSLQLDDDERVNLYMTLWPRAASPDPAVRATLTWLCPTFRLLASMEEATTGELASVDALLGHPLGLFPLSLLVRWCIWERAAGERGGGGQLGVPGRAAFSAHAGGWQC